MYGFFCYKEGHVTPTVQKGLSLLQNGRYEEAMEIFLQVLYDDPKDRDALKNIGIAYTELGRNEEAEKALFYYLDLYPDDAEALEGLGCAFYRQKVYYKAYELLTRASSLRPEAPSIYRNLGLVQLAIDKKEEGYENLKKAHVMNLFDYKTAYAYAAACQKTGRLDEAEEILTELLQDYLPEELESTIRKDLEVLRKARLR
jgi:Flp pilus assembly protein TadD